MFWVQNLVYGYCYCVLGTTVREVVIVNQFCSVERRLVEAEILILIDVHGSSLKIYETRSLEEREGCSLQ